MRRGDHRACRANAEDSDRWLRKGEEYELNEGVVLKGNEGRDGDGQT